MNILIKILYPIALLMAVFLWIFDRGIWCLVAVLAVPIITPILAKFTQLSPKQLTWIRLAALILLIALQCVSICLLKAHKNAHDTGETWAQYGAL
ncbi:MAG: hypothetical protein Q4G13_09100 [Moraxella sp.]|nr:hypothetical protein [Moraxella sp.]